MPFETEALIETVACMCAINSILYIFIRQTT